jgi:hypothetical protein
MVSKEFVKSNQVPKAFIGKINFLYRILILQNSLTFPVPNGEIS